MGSSEVVLDERGAPILINMSTVDVPDIAGALRDSGENKIADALGQWINKVAPPLTRRRGRFGGILDRDRYLSPVTYFDKVRLAREAMRDDVIGGAADGTEALAIDQVSVECEDARQEDVWNQILGDLNMDGQLRKHWRALFSDSAAVCAVWWGTKTYTPRLTGPAGNAARKKFDLQVPVGITFLDGTKIVPVGSLMFGQEMLAYAAEPLEAAVFDQILARRDGQEVPATPARLMRNRRPIEIDPTGSGTSIAPISRFEIQESSLDDPIVRRLIVGRYIPDVMETLALLEDGVEDLSRLYLLDPAAVFRSTATRLDYDRFPEVRGESWFELLDLKAQLRQMDRVHLVGGSHMIIIVRKGTDDIPALPEEIRALQASARTIASVPLIVGDHRLTVDIITPKLDVTLNREKHDTIDVRLFARAWGSFIPTGDDLGDPTKIGQVIGRHLQSRRKMMRRDWELHLFQQIRDRNPTLMTERAKLVFQPANIALAFDQAWASFLLDLRGGGEIAQGTVLAQFGISIADEARKVKREREAYGKLFQENAPFNPFGPQSGQASPDDDEPVLPTKVARRAGGRQGGGTRSGGGAAPGTGQGQKPTGRSRSGGGRRARTQDTTEEPTDE